MESQAAFVLFAFLYLASPLATVQAARYSGESTVNEGQPWNITCEGANWKSENDISWTRNDQTPEEVGSGSMWVDNSNFPKESVLRAKHATEAQEGIYRCMRGDNDTFQLSITTVTKIKVLTDKDVPLTLKCENFAGEVDWFKEGVEVSKAFKNTDVIKIYKENGTLEILKDEPVAFGNYSCNYTVGSNSSTALYRIVPKPTAVLVESVSVVEGEKLHLTCLGKQHPGVKITWTFGKKNYTVSSGRVKLSRDEERGINRAVLNVDDISMDDRGNVTCWVSYDWLDTAEGHSARSDALLRVKDKLAALWPFLGICAEVVVLCAIILIYEKKRNKAELEESDTDQSPDTADLLRGQDSESSFVPLRGPLPPSDLPVRPPVTPPRPSSPVYKTVQFRSPSREPRRDSPLRSAPPSPTSNETRR